MNISLSARTYSIFENEARVAVTVTLTDAYSQDITVNVNLAEIGCMYEYVLKNVLWVVLCNENLYF